MKVLFPFALFAALTACHEPNPAYAQVKAAEYAKANFPNYTVINNKCESFDSDNNGMVRCNLSLQSPTGAIVTPGVECPYYSIDAGCGVQHEMCELVAGSSSSGD